MEQKCPGFQLTCAYLEQPRCVCFTTISLMTFPGAEDKPRAMLVSVASILCRYGAEDNELVLLDCNFEVTLTAASKDVSCGYISPLASLRLPSGTRRERPSPSLAKAKAMIHHAMATFIDWAMFRRSMRRNRPEPQSMATVNMVRHDPKQQSMHSPHDQVPSKPAGFQGFPFFTRHQDPKPGYFASS